MAEGIEVLLRTHRKEDACALLRELDPQRDLKRFDESWKPLLASSAEEDRKWDWRSKFMDLQTVNYEYYAIECEEALQGLMVIDVDFHRTRERNLNLVYVSFLATAPWNRPKIVKEPKFRRVGQLLLRHALVRSEELGYRFRAGLHSLPGSEWFYDMLHLRNYGSDPGVGNFKYYEFSEQLGKAFVEG